MKVMASRELGRRIIANNIRLTTLSPAATTSRRHHSPLAVVAFTLSALLLAGFFLWGVI